MWNQIFKSSNVKPFLNFIIYSYFNVKIHDNKVYEQRSLKYLKCLFNPTSHTLSHASQDVGGGGLLCLPHQDQPKSPWKTNFFDSSVSFNLGVKIAVFPLGRGCWANFFVFFSLHNGDWDHWGELINWVLQILSTLIGQLSTVHICESWHKSMDWLIQYKTGLMPGEPYFAITVKLGLIVGAFCTLIEREGNFEFCWGYGNHYHYHSNHGTSK